MATVRFLIPARDAIEVTVPVGTTVLQAAQRANAPEGSACGGVCACSTCHVYVRKGASLLSETQDEENDILDKAFAVEATSRLGCQAIIEHDGVLEVEITRESFDTWYNEHPDERRALEGRRRE